jgi:hypothetical protein
MSILRECSSAWLKLSILLYDNCMEAGSGSVLLKYMLSLTSDVGVVWFGGWFACDCTVSLNIIQIRNKLKQVKTQLAVF